MIPLGDAQNTRTIAIIVTYGDRYHFLEQVVNGVFANEVWKVVIVDNASSVRSSEAMQKLMHDSNERVTIVALPENRGSAGGFKAGLQHACTYIDCEFLWLLDDDNRPTSRALAELLRQYAKSSQEVDSDGLAFVAWRNTIEAYDKLARGVPLERVFARESSFMGCHIMDQPRKLCEFVYSHRPVGERPSLRRSPMSIPYAAYGGLFFHKSVVSKLGYPDHRFFLYWDDIEFTYRFTKGGGKLFLVPSSVVDDLDRPWHIKPRGTTFFSHLLLAESHLRVYYATRNQSYLESHVWPRTFITYTINKWLFFLLLSLSALWHRRWKRYSLILRAVRAGKAAKLGWSQEFDGSEPLADQKKFL